MVMESSRSLEYTPTWVVAVVCSIIVLISLCAERALHRLGKWLERKGQHALFEALQKLKEELMLLGFISLLLTVFQGLISHMCIPTYLQSHMLPCKRDDNVSSHESEINIRHDHLIEKNGRRLLSTDNGLEHCGQKGKVPLLSLEALHQLHIFIFVLAVVHVIFCATTMVLGGAKIREWKHWEGLIKQESSGSKRGASYAHHIREFFSKHTIGRWRKTAVVSWLVSFFKQFHGSVTKSDYIALREGFMMTHCPGRYNFDFHKYMMQTLEDDFRRVVGISWYLWLFVVLFLLLNVGGWHTYFWLSFLPLILLLLVGAKLEHIITQLAEDVNIERSTGEHGAVKPSDKHFWFGRPSIVFYSIHFILFQNSFEIAFFFWILCTYGFKSCIMEKVGYIVPRLIMGVIVQVLCSYSTLPLYALVSQMGSLFKRAMFDTHMQKVLQNWADSTRSGGEGRQRGGSSITAVGPQNT
ncbi:MLO-like protein 13 [Malania oleifera]|uniref:MLO-like protein 13 n=1 Tax=Malania oleifera TaxID=397392 RepID=UPI0025AE2258|nr:MLO-like protein 13 [Malania oleifera]